MDIILALKRDPRCGLSSTEENLRYEVSEELPGLERTDGTAIEGTPELQGILQTDDMVDIDEYRRIDEGVS